MFEIRSYTRPEYLPLQIDDSVTWWSRRYRAWISGTVVEMKVSKRTKWIYDGAPGKYRPEHRIIERIAVSPSTTSPSGYPPYRIYVTPANLAKL